MTCFKSFASAVAIGAALISALPSGAEAQSRNGIDLRPGRDCGIQVYLSNSGGIAVPKADARLSGSYVFHLYQAIPTSDLDLRLSGRFSGNGARDTALARNHFALGYVVAGGYRGMDELRDASRAAVTPAQQARARLAAVTAAREADASAPRRLTAAQCARLRAARPAQCRYD